MLWIGVARHEEDADAVLISPDQIRKLKAIDPGHGDVGQQQVDLLFAIAKELEGARRVLRFEHGVAEVAKRARREFTNVLAIFDEKDGFSSLLQSPGVFRLLRRDLRLNPGQIDTKGTAVSEFRVHEDAAGALLDDPVDRRKS